MCNKILSILPTNKINSDKEAERRKSEKKKEVVLAFDNAC
jgi:hypothetical protein